MIRFVARRIGLVCITLLVVSLVIFIVTEILPGDVAQMMLKQSATPEGLARIRNELGLYRPAHVRYLDWIGGVLRGDWGDSYVRKMPITDILGRRLWHSAILGVFAFLVGVPTRNANTARIAECPSLLPTMGAIGSPIIYRESPKSPRTTPPIQSRYRS